jgi:L,D-transpeptidase catalytic domain/Putative peptidoglycan binding domain
VLGSARVTIPIVLGVALLLAGGAYAAYRYDAATADRLLPGVRIAGIDVGEMTRDEAVASLNERLAAELDRDIEVVVRGQAWHVSPRDLGATAVVEPLIDRALAAGQEMTWPERVVRRVFDRPVEYSDDLRIRRDGSRLKGFIATVAEAVNVDPADAAIDYEDGQLVLRRPEMGWSLPEPDARQTLRDALAGDTTSVQLAVDRIEPEVGRDDLGSTIVVDLSELQLHLYDGLREVKTYPVAAGSPSYPTPQGEWTIWQKVENPTWVNPAPDGWGASLPPMIGPGPGNPLGTRALYLDAPGIRIHGTSASYSIGSYASHGCIRMFMDDVEELYEIVPTGTTVHVVP